MPDRIDARVQAMQPFRVEPVLNRPFPDPERSQLPPSHNPMLPPGKPRHRRIEPRPARLRIAILCQRSYRGSGDGLGGYPTTVTRISARVVRGLCRLSREKRA
jgi:hypothetical protein